MRYACLLMLTMTGLLRAQDGAAIYKQRCASCHDSPAGRIPSIGAIRQMTGEAIYAALTNGSMKSQTSGLSTQEVLSLLVYIAPAGIPNPKPSFEKSCSGNTLLKPGASAWAGWSPSVTNARYQDAKAAGLAAADVPRLKLKWAFNLGAVTMARGQPAVAGDRVFAGTLAGDVYAIDATSGCIHWAFRATAGVRSGVTVGDANGIPAVFFGDRSAVMYAVNAESGELIWKIRPVEHLLATATATPQFYKGVIYEGFASIEEALAADPKAVCCTFRGSVVALDAATGRILWESFTIPEPAKPIGNGRQQGPSGAAIWSTPTIDEQKGAIYVATGDNYSNPVTATSDAVLAFDLKTGQLLWSRQLTQGDAYNSGCSSRARANCPDKDGGPDFDFGQPPILLQLGAGKRALVIGQKSGMVHALDPDAEGKILWQTRAGMGGLLGGSQWGSAADSQHVYVAISDAVPHSVADATAPEGHRIALDPKIGGGLHAIDLKSGTIVWSARPPACRATQSLCSPAQSAAVTAIPGAVFSGSLDGHLRAYSSTDGQVIWDFDTARQFPTVNGKPARGGSIDATGAAVAGGLVVVNSGYNQFGGMPGNVLLAFSVDGK
ncbi:MAG TPA: PQQ-binding-like beta-propeller repeat protein [Bryobacteraceae bacterium]|nr:PQQ-binding-like beta-propeller repeat protein [Bryobacteraceae bacterium]